MSKQKLGRLEAPNEGRRLVDKFVRQQRDSSVSKDATRRPVNGSETDGTDLLHASSASLWLGELPAPDNVPRRNRTHDVNDKMLTEADRRGLRIGRAVSWTSRNLNFLAGRGDIVKK